MRALGVVGAGGVGAVGVVAPDDTWTNTCAALLGPKKKK